MNLRYGVFTAGDSGRPRIGVAVGDRVLDAGTVAGAPEVLRAPSMNPLLAAGRPVWSSVRRWLEAIACDASCWLEPGDLTMQLPFEVADYVDFYSSEHHARNLGRILRPGSPELMPNWKHLPVGYHGRSGTVVVSGTPVVRPRGQLGPGEFGPCRRLDIEAEIGFVVGVPGRRIPLARLADHVFGLCLVNDWSARDVQAFEAAPLGPFLGKSFATSISPWIVPLDELDAVRVRPPERDVPLVDYLDDRHAEPWGLDMTLEVRLNGVLLSCPEFAAMYWTPAQQLAHLTVGGASVRTGDLFASGTVSDSTNCGSLIELTENGARPLCLPDGSVRTFLCDGDEVTISASAPGPENDRIDLGSVAGRVAPAA